MSSDAETASTSTSSFLTSLIVNGILFLIFFTCFLVLRGRNRRIYQPKTFLETIPEDQRTEPLPVGTWAWAKSLFYRSDAYVLRQAGLDGYFFLRYMRLVIMISAVGIVVLFPILLPVNATGGAGQTGLDILSFTNVSNQKRYYAHVFLLWIYFGIILFLIYREFIYFLSVRQAVLTSPYYWNRVSFRTVLFQSVPEAFLNERSLYALFPEAKNIWINRSYAELAGYIKKRDKFAYKLEGAEISLIKKGLKTKAKQEKKNADIEKIDSAVGPVSDYVPDKKRPHHRLKPLVGKKVDTIEYSREQLAELNPKIKELQDDPNRAKLLNSAFIEFSTPETAFDALQLVAHHMPLHMAPRYHGLRPEDIIWFNLRLLWWERLIRVYSSTAFLVVLVIFWSIPVAVVGIISNITYITDKVHFLRFILNLPSALLGIVTSLLPTVMLAVLMMLLPIILRLMARVAGVPSHSLVELHVQNSYFLFQVVQVFLVTTITSSASSVVTKIIEEPTSAMTVLAQNLPKSSNFFIAYLMLQGLTVAGSAILQLVGSIVFKVCGMLLDNSPRKMYKRWVSLSAIGWGTVFPIYTNLAVIAITYSVISPLILLFSGFGFGLLYVAYLYNFMYVYKPQVDLTGMAYPRALWQTFTGLYLAEVCMLGLFVVGKNWACVVIVAIALGFTAFFQITLQNAMMPLLAVLPKSIQMQRAHSMGLDANFPPSTATTPKETVEKTVSNDVEAAANYESARQKAKYSSLFWKFMRPDIYASYLEMKDKMVPDWKAPEYTVDEERHAYTHPAVTAQAPFLWVPRDKYGWSSTEIEASASVIGISDEGSHFDDKNKIVREGLPPDYEEEKHL
ncbi:uncharacterized protein V1518DRAFT_394340 [Limtongia smithiae]|uniref:uncharacterized protein n=1 Tax=Limtongia smithiae TaxID=1125753 RepID=UPI0034CDE324